MAIFSKPRNAALTTVIKALTRGINEGEWEIPLAVESCVLQNYLKYGKSVTLVKISNPQITLRWEQREPESCFLQLVQDKVWFKADTETMHTLGQVIDELVQCELDRRKSIKKLRVFTNLNKELGLNLTEEQFLTLLTD